MSIIMMGLTPPAAFVSAATDASAISSSVNFNTPTKWSLSSFLASSECPISSKNSSAFCPPRSSNTSLPPGWSFR